MNFKNLWTCSALIVALLPGAGPAANHIADITWSADGRFVHKTQVAAGKFVEVCGKLAAGDSVRWSFEAGAPLDFNIHYHVGKEVVFPVKLPQARAGRDTLKVEVPQDYCWMWTNKGTVPAGMTVELTR